MNLKSETIIFIDGSSRGNPGPGGWGAVLIIPNSQFLISNRNDESQIIEIGGREKYTTNNRMELQAAISALSFLSNVTGQMPIVIYSDSSYLINGITKWVFGWQKNGWKTKAKELVENRDLWEQLINLTIYRKVSWRQISGHVGVAGNERCDVIARTYADLTKADAEKKLELYSGPLEKYPIKNILSVLYDISYKSKRDDVRSRGKLKAYSYISRVDGKIETHKTWAECEARVKGRNGAKFKKSLSKENEAEIIAEWNK